MFADREAAGRALSRQLRFLDLGKENPVVLCVARGGIPLGKIVAEELGGDLDICTVGRIPSPTNPDLTVAAFTENGDMHLTDRNNWQSMRKYLEEARAKEIADMKHRRLFYNVPTVSLNRRCVILIDDGIQTGSSILVALREVRKSNPSKIIIAAPVCSIPAFEKLRKKRNVGIVALNIPQNFICVAQFYQDFTPVTDLYVRDALNSNRLTDRPGLAESGPEPNDSSARAKSLSLSLTFSSSDEDEGTVDTLEKALLHLDLPITPPSNSAVSSPILSPGSIPRAMMNFIGKVQGRQ